MTGNKTKGIVVQNRDLRLLGELGVMRIMDREMAGIIGQFGVRRRVNACLHRLTRAGLLRRFFVGSVAHGRKAVYTLSPKGAELVGSAVGGIRRPANGLVTSDGFVEHQTAINEIYLLLKFRPVPQAGLSVLRWITFHQPISEAVKLKPDAYLELAAGALVRAMFLEVDLGTEALKVWQQKTAAYLRLAVSGEFARRFRQPQFRVLVVTRSEKRLASIRSAVSKSTTKIFWFTTFDAIKRDGLWSPVWLRPSGDQRQSLI
jgi:hypothetical protein